MSTAYEELVELLDERGIGYWTNENQAVRLDLRGEVAVYRLTAGVEPETDLFQVVGRSPVLVPEGCRPAAAETIARANYGLRLGKFELDLDDGEVRFQVSQILVDDAVGQTVIDRMIGTTVTMLETYLPALLSVIYANESPKEAIGRVEAGWSGNDRGTDDVRM
jgi:hypothetical protein